MNGKARALLVAVTAFLVSACFAFVVIARSDSPGQSAIRGADAPVAQTQLSVATTRDTAIGKVRALTAINRRIDRVAAKLTTFGAVQAARGDPNEFVAYIPNTTIVWAVAVSGDVAPSHARQAYAWQVMLYDAQTGEWLASFANDDGRSWPQWFDSLLDQSIP